MKSSKFFVALAVFGVFSLLAGCGGGAPATDSVGTLQEAKQSTTAAENPATEPAPAAAEQAAAEEAAKAATEGDAASAAKAEGKDGDVANKRLCC